METWLRTNHRALLLAMVVPLTACLLGLLLLLYRFGDGLSVLRIVGGVVLLLGLFGLAALGWQLRQPRLAYSHGQLLVYLRRGQPIRVPIEFVEGFLVGHAPAARGSDDDDDQMQASTIVIRLAESAQDFAHIDVDPQLGHWCDGYITIRGTWCQPIHVRLAEQLNARLHEAKQAHAQVTS